MIRWTHLRAGVAAALLSAGPGIASAQSADTTAQTAPGDIGTAFVFNRICYAQVPHVQNIRNMAMQLAWKPVTVKELEQFKVMEAAETLEGWDAQVGERIFRIGVAQGPATPSLKQAFPALASGTMTSCTMVLDGQDDAKALYDDVRALAAKEPVSRDVGDGALKTTTWAGGNDEVKVFLVLKADKANAGNLINVVVLTK